MGRDLSFSARSEIMDPELIKKKREYEAQKARTKLALRNCTICGAANAKLCRGCGTTAYCSEACQKVDWRNRGHKKACKKIRDDRAAEAARAKAPTRPPSPPRDVFYGPAPRSHADEVRARIAAEHEAARARREANPEREPMSTRYGSRCPFCLEDWDVNEPTALQLCCCQKICVSCMDKTYGKPCPLCRMPCPSRDAEALAMIRRHVENDVPEAMTYLGNAYREGQYGLVKSMKKTARLYKRAVELGNVEAMLSLGGCYSKGFGVKLDKKKAERLVRMAADRGDAMAQAKVAILCEKVLEQPSQAFRLMKLAAEQGYTKAEAKLGQYFLTGVGVEADLDQAKHWFARAAAKGHERAREKLAELNAA